ncbi:MAG: pilus assembly protein [Rhizobiaceae bacterium]|nr:pilus assembly protein [Rhizobiaceae bacterium]
MCSPLRAAARFCQDKAGVSTVEFAMVTPVILLIMAGTLDLGRALMTRFEVTSAVSASTNYALLNADRVNSKSGSALATEIATVAASSLQSNQGDITVVINNGSSVNVNNGTPQPSGTAANADSCYCPTMSGYSVTWGSTKTCGSACSGGGLAGKFVTITASKPYTPMFTGYGIVEADAITVRAIVQPQ